MTRAEHLQWAKDRALEYVEKGDVQQAFASFASDLTKHPELESSQRLNAQLGMQMLIAGHLNTPMQMREWINGFN